MQNAFRVRSILHVAVAGALSLTLGACAARRLSVPSDAGAPFAGFAEAYKTATTACAGVRTMTAELGLSGRAGDRRIRGRAIVGFASPDSLRLEGVAPFGPPAFILAARGGTGTLLLPRDNRAVRRAAPADILEALTGVALSPTDLQAVLTGCVVPAGMPSAGRLHQNGWVSIEVGDGARLYLEREGTSWRVRAGLRQGWQVEYPAWQGAFPSTVRLISPDRDPAVDLTATISQLETNVPLDDAAFAVDVPAGVIDLSVA